MASYKTDKDLIIWNKEIELIVLIYKLTSNFPQEEKFGITSQMRRCAISIPSNLTVAWGRDSMKSFVQFFKIVSASLMEFVTEKEDELLSKLMIEESKMINSFINKIKD
ncbi:MAG: four helix bundle protein [Chitinophagales bacterium]|jgi:four helix bundle protein